MPSAGSVGDSLRGLDLTRHAAARTALLGFAAGAVLLGCTVAAEAAAG